MSTAQEVVVASGKKILTFLPGQADEDMLKKVTGRTGNLRAPTLFVGEKYYVGYNSDLYDQICDTFNK